MPVCPRCEGWRAALVALLLYLPQELQVGGGVVLGRPPQMFFYFFLPERHTMRAVLQFRILLDRNGNWQMRVTEGTLPLGVKPVRILKMLSYIQLSFTVPFLSVHCPCWCTFSVCARSCTFLKQGRRPELPVVGVAGEHCPDPPLGDA